MVKTGVGERVRGPPFLFVSSGLTANAAILNNSAQKWEFANLAVQS